MKTIAIKSVCVCLYSFLSILFIVTGSVPAITVNIYSGHTDTGGGTPYTGFVGSFRSPDIMFWTSADHQWNPYSLHECDGGNCYDSFGAEIFTNLLVEADDTYEFKITTDDGAMVYIDENLAMNYGGGGMKMGTNQIYLTAGLHTLWIEYFEDWGVTSGIDLTLPDGVNYGDILLEKDDSLDDDPNTCVIPNSEYSYTIHYENTTEITYTDVYIVDYLPQEVDFLHELINGQPVEEPNTPSDPNLIWECFSDPNCVLLNPAGAQYDPQTHTITWLIGTLAPQDEGEVSFSVRVNDRAVPLMNIRNVAEIADSNSVLATAIEDTAVCCWGGEVVYVDKNVPESNPHTGSSWQCAYPDLQSGLERARNGCGSEIRVADGSYNPGDTFDWYSYSDTFEIPAGTTFTGGWAGYGASNPDERDPKKYKSILTGYIGEDQWGYPERNTTVVTLLDETVLDGFTVTQSDRTGQGIYASDVDCSIANCIIEKNDGYGAYFANSNIEITFSRIRDNYYDGIYHSGSGKTLTLENVWVQRSRQFGIRCEYSTPTIRNSNITESDLALEGRAGLRLVNSTNQPILQNVTCAHNKAKGIEKVGSGSLPSLQNCVIFHNGGPALSGFTADQAAYYSCIEDCNSVNYNISSDPEFVYFDPENVRISTASPCKDTGNPSLNYDNQLDMDSRARKSGDYVDRGAYEVIPDCESDSNDLDLNHDGVINLDEFSLLSASWLSWDPNTPGLGDPNLAIGWNPLVNFSAVGDSQYVIDLADLEILWSNWLWQACWFDLEQQQQMMMSAEASSFAAQLEAQPVVVSETLTLIIGHLDELLNGQPDNTATILEIKGILEGWLDELQTQEVQME